MRVFLSYRRGDAGGYTGRLHEGLAQRLGPKRVFQDIAAIAPGEDFTVAIDRALDNCDVVLAVIGPGWLSASSPHGERRLWEEGDYVRLELGRALERDLPVVPLLVGGASLPAAGDLPESLSILSQRQTVELHDDGWRQDVDALVRRLRGVPEPTQRRARLAKAGVAAALVLATAGIGTWWLLSGGDGREGDGTGAQTPGAQTSAVQIPGVHIPPGPCMAPTGEAWASLPLTEDPIGEERSDDGSFLYTVREAKRRTLGPTNWEVILSTTVENRTATDTYQNFGTYTDLVVGNRLFKQTCFSPSPLLVDAGRVGDALVGFEVSCEPNGYIELRLAGRAQSIRVTDPTEAPAC